jgi:hypothetical protein
MSENNRNGHRPFTRDTPAGRRGWRDAMAGKPFPPAAIFDGWPFAKQRNYERGRLHAMNVRAHLGDRAPAERTVDAVWEAAAALGNAVPESRGGNRGHGDAS